MRNQVLEGFPLSVQQRSAWQRQKAARRILFAHGAVLIEGPLDREALRTAVKDLVDRHEILRTAFRRAPGLAMPVQVIAEPGAETFRFRESIASGAFDIAEDWAAERAAAQGSNEAFCARFHLAEENASRHFLLLTLPALCADEPSLDFLFLDLVRCYQAARGEAPPPDEPVQYVDISAWQHELLEEEGEGPAYWAAQLSQESAIFTLPVDESRAAAQQEPARVEVRLPEGQRAALYEMAEEAGVTPEVFLLTCWMTVLGRFAAREEITVGVFSDGRAYEELAGAVGPLARILPVRASVVKEQKFVEVARRLHGVVEEQRAWQDSFPSVSEGALPPNDFMFLRRFDRTQAAALCFLPQESVLETKPAQLRLRCEQRGQRLFLHLIFDLNRCSPVGARRIAEQFETLLGSVLKAPQARLRDLSMLSENAARRILGAWNQTTTDFPQDLTLPRLFEAQAEATPTASALLWQNEAYSYRALNEDANRLAHFLQERGVRLGTVVALCIDRSPEMATAVLGVLKTGAAYVALDPSHPRARLAFILEESRARLLLTQRHLVDKLPPVDAEIVCLDGAPALAKQPSHNPDATTLAAAPAYITYTSGSTGRPKGVVASHRGAVNYITYLTRTYALGPSDRVLQVAGLAFDASVRDLLGPLTVGASVVLVPSHEATDPRALWRHIRHYEITALLSLVPTMLRGLVKAARAAGEAAPAVQTLLVSGEPLFFGDYEAAQAAFGEEMLVANQYGPTECTMTCSYHVLGRADASRQPVLIGRPIANTRFYVLDADMRPVAEGEPGELYVGGVGLSFGYLRQPAGTAERFVPDPFGGVPGARLFRTGDRVRYRFDGRLDFIGRGDHQIKLRGLRVEPGEIEQVLLQQEDVQVAVVIARGEGEAIQLIAYVTGNGAASQDELRAFMEDRLPAYMIPSAVVRLDKLPLTPNGKIDRRALPAPEEVQRPETGYMAPRTQTEERLTCLFAEVLGVKRVGVNDDFFALGGHSLLAIQLAFRIQEAFGEALPLAVLFRMPTPAGLARLLDAAAPHVEGPLVPLREGGALPPLFCLHPLGGEVFGFQPLADALGEDRSVYALQSRGLADPAEEHHSLEAMAADYAAAIRLAQPEGPYHLLGWSMGGVVALAVAGAMEQRGQEVHFVGLLDVGMPGWRLKPGQDGAGAVPTGRLQQALEALGLDAVQPPGSDLAAMLNALPVALAEEGLEAAMAKLGVGGEAQKGRLGGLIQRRLALARRHDALLDAHKPTSIRAPLHLFWAAESPLRQRHAGFPWAEITNGAVHEVMISGTHQTLLQPPHHVALARHIAARLRSVEDSG